MVETASPAAQLVKNQPTLWETGADPWVGKIPWRRERSGRSPGEGKGNPLQYFALKNFMDCRVRGVTKSQTGLSNFHFQHRLNIKFTILSLSECTVKWH